MDDTSPVSVGFLRQTLTAILAEHAKLAARVASFERKKVMCFEGPFDPSRVYEKGSVVQRSGNLFVSLVETDEAPAASPLWRQIGVCK
ncbi:MAG: hypothetical protein Q8P42_06095 [Gallionella sp.]|nr:hypothetical protein [Gallionella sp.]